MKILIVAAMLLFQAGDDPEPDRPASCDNHLQTPAAERCACERAMQKCNGMPEPPAKMTSKCKTYCREDHCGCAGSSCRS